MHTSLPVKLYTVLVVVVCIVGFVVGQDGKVGFEIQNIADNTPVFPYAELVLFTTATNASIQFINQFGAEITILVDNQLIVTLEDNSTTPYLPLIPFGSTLSFTNSTGQDVIAPLQLANSVTNNVLFVTLTNNDVAEVQNPISSYSGLFTLSTDNTVQFSSFCVMAEDNSNITCTAFESTGFDFDSFNGAVGDVYQLAIQINPNVVDNVVVTGQLELVPFYYGLASTDITPTTEQLVVKGLFNTSETYVCLFISETDATNPHTSAGVIPNDTKTLQCEIPKQVFGDKQQKISVSVVGIPFAGQNTGLLLNYNPNTTEPNKHWMWYILGGGAGVSLIVVIIVLVIIRRNRNAQYSPI